MGFCIINDEFCIKNGDFNANFKGLLNERCSMIVIVILLAWNSKSIIFNTKSIFFNEKFSILKATRAMHVRWWWSIWLCPYLWPPTIIDLRREGVRSPETVRLKIFIFNTKFIVFNAKCKMQPWDGPLYCDFRLKWPLFRAVFCWKSGRFNKTFSSEIYKSSQFSTENQDSSTENGDSSADKIVTCVTDSVPSPCAEMPRSARCVFNMKFIIFTRMFAL